MAPFGSLAVPLAVLVLLLWGAPWTHGQWSNVHNFMPRCPACQNLQPEWESFAEWGEDLEVNAAKVDVTEQPGPSGQYIITALPNIYHC
uniref:Thioredoxin domain-containing protein n=1 Tax=Aotus nancymaae TaxID=37293 RepID=A0A2K5CMF1_AOTNA